MAWNGGAPLPPADNVYFTDFDQAQNWFLHQSREVCIALSARSVLRVMPLIEARSSAANFASRVALPVLRACFVAWAIAQKPARLDRLRRAVLAASVAVDAVP